MGFVSARTGLSFCALMVAVSAFGAEDNLFGLPAPRDAHRPGSLMLHGGGQVTNDAFNKFVALAGGPNARIVFVPCAGFRRAWYGSDTAFLSVVGQRYGSWVNLVPAGEARSFQFVFTDDPDDADDADFCKPLETATGVWFSGGLQERLKYRFVGAYPQQTRFQQLLKQVVAKGGVVGGTSAGMAALPEIMTMWQDRDYSDGPVSAVPAHGFGLLTKAVVEQHFDARGGRLERFMGLLRDSQRLDKLAGRAGAGAPMVGLAVEERVGLVVRGGGGLEIVGDGSAHIFLKSIGGRTTLWHELAAGEKYRLTRAANGTPSLLAE